MVSTSRSVAVPPVLPTSASPAPVRWRSRNFHGVAYLLVVLLVGANIPSALYGLYRTEFGFSAAVQTAIFAVYVVGMIPSLLLFGPLSDALGRRAVLGFAAAAGVVGATTMAFADATVWLFLGRIAQGIAVGAVSAAGTAALVDYEPDGDHQRAALVSSAGGALGGGLGPLVGGVVAQYLPHPLQTPFVVFLVALLPAVIAVALLPRGLRDRSAPLVRLPAIPAAIRRTFWLSTIAVGLSWGGVGLFQAVVPSWITGQLGVSNLVVGAAAASLVMVCSVAAQAVSGRLSARRAERTGLVVLVVGMLGLAVVAREPVLALLFVVTAVVGAGQGLTFAGGLRSVNAAVVVHAPGSQGGVLAAFYVVSYVGLAVPILAAGVAITAWGTGTAVTVLGVLGAVLCAAILVLGAVTGRTSPRR
ncbi:MFS transporter [Rhodococcus sp. NPDC003318]|uniref:MFS transporter n=1 Tax=Rhodococcus sp. NPDC003318 TaxID=3364503 RepID=UPI0036AFF4AA